MSPVTPSGDLVRAAQLGDHRAFTDLIRSADARMRRLAFRLVGSQAAMDDVLQDAYLKAYRHLGTYKGDAAFSTWLYRIVYRTCLDHLRTRSRRPEVGLYLGDAPPAADADHAARTVDADALISALGALRKDQAAVVLLVDGEGLSYAEAAAVLDVRSGTIASRLNRAHTALRTALDEGGSRS